MRRGGRARTFYIYTRIFCVCASIAFAQAIKYGVPIEINHWDTGRSPLKRIVDVTNSLGLKVLAEHNFLNDNNIAFSPYGLMGIMVALYEGVDGVSSHQIRHAMRLPWDRNVLRIGFRDIHRTLKTYFVPEEGFLAGLVLNDDNIIFNEYYTQILKFYGFDLESYKPTTPSPGTNMTEAPSSTTTDAGYSTTDITTSNTDVTQGSTMVSPDLTTTTEGATVTSTTLTTSSEPETSTTSTLSTDITQGSTTMTPDLTTSTEGATITSTTLTTSSEPETSTTSSLSTDLTQGSTTMTPDLATSTEGATVTSTTLTTSSEPETSTTPIPSTDITQGSTTMTPDLTTSTEGATASTTKEPTTPQDNQSTSTISSMQTTDTSTIMTGSTTEDFTSTTQSMVTSTTNIGSTSDGEILTTSTTDSVTSTTESTTDNAESGPNQSTTLIDDSVLRTLKRRKKSIEEFRFTQLPYDEHLNYRSFDIGPETVDARYGGDHLFLANGILNTQATYMSYDTVLDHAILRHLDATAIRLPLDSMRYYLLVMLPNRKRPGEISRLLGRMARRSDLSDIYASLRPRRVRALVPSFFVKGRVSLTTDLQRLGMKNVFQPRQNDFKPMTNQTGVYVRNIEQAVSVAIRKYSPDETKNNRHAGDKQRMYFYATYPFLYFVMDANIHVALMAGKLVDPLNTRIQ